MTDCEMCGNNSDKCYTVDLKITSDFDKDEYYLYIRSLNLLDV